ncbi:MAG: glycosyl hydrolase family 76, partial [Tannerella sp.]|nr:glycosyl hydrolase family 76 [Tannerella sp.]
AADSCSRALIRQFWNSREDYFNTDNAADTTFQYWPQAHALDVITDAYLRSGDAFWKPYYDRWYAGVKAKNGNTFWGEYYDDMEWNALAVLRAYEATKEEKFKTAALEIWDYIKEGWNDNAGGGLTWKKGMEYSKNACSNGPACILAARLYKAFGRPADKDWALRIYNWERKTLFNAADGRVYDNIDSRTGKVQKAWVFTYNEGTFIGSAVELYGIFHKKSYLEDAAKAADYSLDALSVGGILKPEGKGDGGLFKGVFVRYLTELIEKGRDLPLSKRETYKQFLLRNAEILWTQGTLRPACLFGPDWRKLPSVPAGLTADLSGCMLIEAAARLSKP